MPGATVYRVRIKLDQNELGDLRIGMNGDARIILREETGVLVLPLEAVVDGEVVLTSGLKKKIETGIEGETVVEIKSGLNEGDQVVI